MSKQPERWLSRTEHVLFISFERSCGTWLSKHVIGTLETPESLNGPKKSGIEVFCSL
jgi:hypothetical protein